MPKYKDMLNKAAKAWNCPDMLDSVKDCIPKIPFSAPMLNWMTYGGVPRGRIVEFFGEEGGGKSSTAIDICASAKNIFQKEFEDKVQEYRDKISQGKKEYTGPLEDLLDQGPKAVVYWDLEHSFDWQWAGKMGLKKGEIDVAQPPDVAAEDQCQLIQDAIVTGEIGLVVIDSVPSLVTKSELEKKYGERTVSALAGLMTIFMRKLTPLTGRYDCTVILINQVRENMDNPYVVQTPGGKAIKFYCTTRIYFRKGAPVDFAGNELPQNTENPNGYLINTKLMKQKGAAFDRKVASYFLMADSGIREDFDYAKLAIQKYNIIQKSGGWFTMCNPETGEVLEDEGKVVKINGLVRVYDYLATHSDYYNAIKRYINADIGLDTSTMDGVAPSESEVVCNIDDGSEGEA